MTQLAVLQMIARDPNSYDLRLDEVAAIQWAVRQLTPPEAQASKEQVYRAALEKIACHVFEPAGLAQAALKDANELPVETKAPRDPMLCDVREQASADKSWRWEHIWEYDQKKSRYRCKFCKRWRESQPDLIREVDYSPEKTSAEGQS